MKRTLRIVAALVVLTCGLLSLGVGRDAAAEPVEQQGCCSWHQGVCGCLGHHVQCCDGTQSPTCKC